MAVTAKFYNLGVTSAFNKEVDWGTDTVKVMLCTSTYTPSQTAHQYKSSVTNEVTGTGYTAGGATLGTKTEAFSSQVKAFDAADTVWTTSTITARYAVVYVSTGSDATSPLLCYVDFGADVSSTAANFTIAWDALGIFGITVA
jgi:isochorismate hydrolase